MYIFIIASLVCPLDGSFSACSLSLTPHPTVYVVVW